MNWSKVMFAAGLVAAADAAAIPFSPTSWHNWLGMIAAVAGVVATYGLASTPQLLGKKAP